MKHGPDWDWFVELQRAKLRNYEEYTVTSTVRQPRDTSTYVPSVHHGNYLHSELEDRERRRSEVEFRTHSRYCSDLSYGDASQGGGPSLAFDIRSGDFGDV
jgi:hypothetical protein